MTDHKRLYEAKLICSLMVTIPLLALTSTCFASTATFQGLGDLSGGINTSEARNISADGSTVIGRSESDLGLEAFVWTSSSGMRGLGDLPGGEFWSDAHGVSAWGWFDGRQSQSQLKTKH